MAAIESILKHEPNIGGTDESKCLPGWIATMEREWEAGGTYTLSHNAIGALLHTLVAARQRARRLVAERDAARMATPAQAERQGSESQDE
jgi:hypothetical protein